MRVQTNPTGALAVLYRKPGCPPVVHLNADLITDEQAAVLGRRLNADPGLLAALGLVA
ncbi:hypothetical protein [Kitasatospora sp. CB02891]|uniref:hypothetical protein n=1 Tax=Kitasatospora sp. CB02891 TaxID=2020329 RepID=UPI0012FDE3D6|nr:hypothetical protein [Kitasatospora sp. CB02891]